MRHAHALLLPLVLLLLFGCATSTTDPQVINKVGILAYDAAKLGTIGDLMANPQHRLGFEAAVAGLNVLLSTNTFTSSDVRTALAKLPIKELQGDNGALAIEGGLMIYEMMTMFAWQPESTPALTHVASRIRDGIADALLVMPRPMSVRTLPAGSGVPFKPRLVPVKVTRI